MKWSWVYFGENISLLYWGGGRRSRRGISVGIFQYFHLVWPGLIVVISDQTSSPGEAPSCQLPVTRQEDPTSCLTTLPSPPPHCLRNIPLHSPPLPDPGQTTEYTPSLSYPRYVHVFLFIGSYCQYLNIKIVRFTKYKVLPRQASI